MLKLTDPDQSFDYIAVDPATNEFIAIETQAIDLRGGGVGPAWQSLVEGTPRDWRQFFSREAAAKERKDTVAYGVNMANITKRLGFQVVEKGSLLRQIGAKLYAVAQDRCFTYFAERIPAAWTTDRGGEWDITFLTFDYTGRMLDNGQWEMGHVGTHRTTVPSFSAALAQSTAKVTREVFIRKIQEKLASASADAG